MADTFTNLLVHIVFSTKHREPLIQEPLRGRLYEYIGGIVRKDGGTQLEIGGMPDHVHILARIKADISVSEALRSIKAGSSKWVHDAFREHRRFAWQKGYAAFSVSESQVPVIRRYIRNQEQHHAKSTFKAELIGLLRKHKIEYDERYLFD